MIYVSGLLLGSYLLGNALFRDPKCLGWDPWKLRRYRDKNGEEKNKVLLYISLGAAPARAPQESLYLIGPGTPMPLRVPQTKVYPTGLGAPHH